MDLYGTLMGDLIWKFIYINYHWVWYYCNVGSIWNIYGIQLHQPFYEDTMAGN